MYACAAADPLRAASARPVRSPPRSLPDYHVFHQVLVDNGVDVGALLSKVGIEATGKAETAGPMRHRAAKCSCPAHSIYQRQCKNYDGSELLCCTGSGGLRQLMPLDSVAGTVAIAYAAHKAASPIRFPPTVALTPLTAKVFCTLQPLPTVALAIVSIAPLSVSLWAAPCPGETQMLLLF